MTRQVPIAEGLFTWPAARPALLGSRCRRCGIANFPAGKSCMACSGQDVEIEELPGRGTLWTWTVQRFMPKSPYHSGETSETFQPYGVGYVELPGCVRVESRLTECELDQLHIGMEMEAVFAPYRTDDNGDQVIGFFFRPVAKK